MLQNRENIHLTNQGRVNTEIGARVDPSSESLWMSMSLSSTKKTSKVSFFHFFRSKRPLWPPYELNLALLPLKSQQFQRKSLESVWMTRSESKLLTLVQRLLEKSIFASNGDNPKQNQYFHFSAPAIAQLSKSTRIYSELLKLWALRPRGTRFQIPVFFMHFTCSSNQ